MGALVATQCASLRSKAFRRSTAVAMWRCKARPVRVNLGEVDEVCI